MTKGGAAWVPALLLLTLVSESGVLSGCGAYARSEVVRGRPIDRRAVNRLAIGRSTRDDVLALLGAPYGIVEGQVELEDPETVYGGIGLNQFVLLDQNRYFSSLDRDHYVMLYRFGRTSARAVEVTPAVAHARREAITLDVDELLLVLRKGTDVLEDVAYRRAGEAPAP